MWALSLPPPQKNTQNKDFYEHGGFPAERTKKSQARPCNWRGEFCAPEVWAEKVPRDRKCSHNSIYFSWNSFCLYIALSLPSDTKLLLTKNYSKIIISEKLRISRVIP